MGGGTLPVGLFDRVAMGYSPANGPDRVLANWVIMLLPQLEQDNLYKGFNLGLPVDDPSNANARETSLLFMLCPSDAYNRVPYQRRAFGRNGGGPHVCSRQLRDELRAG